MVELFTFILTYIDSCNILLNTYVD